MSDPHPVATAEREHPMTDATDARQVTEAGSGFERASVALRRFATALAEDEGADVALDALGVALGGHLTEDMSTLAHLLIGQQRRRQQLEVHTQRFGLLASTVADALWDWDLASGQVWRNRAFLRMLGVSETEADPAPEAWQEHVHPDERAEVVGSLQAAIEGQENVWNRDYRFLHSDGSTLYVADRSRVLRDTAGRAVRVVGGITDITAQRAAQDALRASEARFHDLAEHSSEAILLQQIVPESRFVYLNPAIEVLVGVPRDAIYADPTLLTAGITEADRARLWAAIDADTAVVEPVDIDFRIPSGESRRWRFRGTPHRDQNGRVLSVQAAVTDITADHREHQTLRSALAQQHELNDLKTGFVQAVSHELRTPLTTIRGFVELLLARDMPRDEQVRYLGRVGAGAERLQRLVTDVLDLDRLDRPDALIDVAPVDLADIVRLVVAETDAGTHPIHLDLAPAETVADDALLERVVDNLIRNAIKHTPEGTPVWVRTRAPATVIVEDGGPGVAAALRDTVFEPFRQGPDQLERHSPGMGIGLSLSQRIVRLHGGEIRLGERPGGGARFTVTLPVHAD